MFASGDRPDEAQRLATERGEDLDGDLVTGMDLIRTVVAEPKSRQRAGRPGCQDPLGRRAVLVLHRDMHRAMRVGKCHSRERALHFLFFLQVVDAREGVMGLQ